jgi:hypothetical protein
MSEVSNLLQDWQHRLVAPDIVSLCSTMEELSATMGDVVGDRTFDRLGFADCTTLSVTGPEMTVLTDDLDLYIELLARGVNAINFNHLRSSST